ncbi:DUF3575 domain-containing protein [Bacteroides sp. 214]|uniref:DUF3575 domain-containing protein n=1 Tax=Bacteroides sp. 214 TaxID=2302935 RepID=UPI0013D2C00E|nr:DUF3575 domain-containing protein [Bacteroides sp. 214]
MPTLENQRITMASDGSVLSVAKGSYISKGNSNDTITLNYSNTSIGANRHISVWKGDNFPSAFYFPTGKHELMRHYYDNNIMFNAVDELLKSPYIVEALDSIEIIGACSPVGSEEYNIKLAQNRCLSLQSYLQQAHTQLAEEFPIKLNIIGIDKFGYDMLKTQKPPFTEKQIRDRLQYAAIRLKMKDGSYIIPGSDKQKTFFKANQLPSPTITETQHATMRDTVFLKSDTMYITTTEYVYPSKPVKERTPLHLAIKTNLLYDALLLPNLTIEWYMGKQWSLAIEGSLSRWTFGHPIQKRWSHNIQTAGIELRHWFKSPHPLHGHALGFYSMMGKYDVRLFTKDENSKGYQSDPSWSAGLSYGYSFPITHKLNMELGVAIGYVGGKYYKYDYSMTHEHWEKEKTINRNYIGPTRVGVSLVWLPGE